MLALSTTYLVPTLLPNSFHTATVACVLTAVLLALLFLGYRNTPHYQGHVSTVAFVVPDVLAVPMALAALCWFGNVGPRVAYGLFGTIVVFGVAMFADALVFFGLLGLERMALWLARARKRSPSDS